MKLEGFAPSVQTRYNFTINFLVGATTFANKALEIDIKGNNATEEERLQHKAYVAGSIMQSVAALESEVWSLLNHGPGHHLGSNGLDKKAQEILSIVADSFEKEQVITKYNLILQLIKAKKLDLGKQPMQDLKLLIGLRNEITHFKSILTDELDRKNLFKALSKLDPKPPSFYPESGMNFFPHICLNHRRAKWAVLTAVNFIDYYYIELGIASPIDDQNRKYIHSNSAYT